MTTCFNNLYLMTLYYLITHLVTGALFVVISAIFSSFVYEAAFAAVNFLIVIVLYAILLKNYPHKIRDWVR